MRGEPPAVHRRLPGALSPFAKAIAKLGLVSAVTLAGLYSRAPDVFGHPQFWAEDGIEFFQNAWAYGWRSLLLPYAGYLHAVPRLVAIVGTLFNATAAPAVFASLAVAVTVWSAATIAFCDIPAALLLGTVLFAVPGCHEIFGTITNAQWFMQAALLAVVASDSPGGTVRRANQVCFSLLSGLSGPFSLLLSPLAIWRWVRHGRDLHGRLIAAIVLATAVIQLVCLLDSGFEQSVGRSPAVHLLWVIISESIEASPAASHGYISYEGIKLALVMLLIFLAWRCERRFVGQAFVFVLMGLVAIWIRNLTNDDIMFYGWGERYFYMPRLFTIWCVCIVLSRRRFGAIVAVAASAVVFAGPVAWRRPALPILPWRSSAWKIDAGLPVVIITNPSTEATPVEEAWRVTIPPDR